MSKSVTIAVGGKPSRAALYEAIGDVRIARNISRDIVHDIVINEYGMPISDLTDAQLEEVPGILQGLQITETVVHEGVEK